MRAAAWSIRPSSFGWIASSSVTPEMTAPPANRSATSARSVTDQRGAGVAAHDVYRGAAEAAHVLEHRFQHGLKVEQAGAAVHEDEARAGPAHERARPAAVRRALEQALGIVDPLLP